MKNNALWKRVMALGRTVQRQDAHAVLCHGVERSVMFSKCSHVVMHHRQRLRWRVVDEGDGCESCIITDGSGFESWINGVPVVVMDEVFFERGEGFSHLERRECTGDIAGNPAVSVGVPSVPIGVFKSVGPVERIQTKVHFPAVRNSITKRRVERANSEPVPQVAIGVIQQRIGAEPEVFSHRVDGPGGARREQVVERSVRSRREVGPTLEHCTFRKGCMAPQPVQFCCEVGRRTVGVLLGGGEALSVAENTVSVDVKPVVVAVEGQIAPVQRIESRTDVAKRKGVKSSHPVTHVGLVSVRHPVAVRIRHPRVEVDAIVVFVKLARQSTRETRCRTVGRVGPTEFFRGVQSVVVPVG